MLHAVVGIWTRNTGQSEEQLQELRERIVPNVRQSPGFVAGYWTHDSITGKDHTLLVFESEEAAQQCKIGVEQNSQRQGEVGIHRDLLTVVEVVAEAHR